MKILVLVFFSSFFNVVSAQRHDPLDVTFRDIENDTLHSVQVHRKAIIEKINQRRGVTNSSNISIEANAKREQQSKSAGTTSNVAISKPVKTSVFANKAPVSTNSLSSISAKKIRWNGKSVFYSAEGHRSDEKTHVIINGNKIEWRNSDGSMRKIFSVVQVRGDGLDQSNKISIQYSIKHESVAGSVVIKNKGTRYSILIILESSMEAEVYEIDVENFVEL